MMHVTKTRWGHLEFTWKVDDVYALRGLSETGALEVDADGQGCHVKSPSFGDSSIGLWRLQFHPIYTNSTTDMPTKLPLGIMLEFDTEGTTVAGGSVKPRYVTFTISNPSSGDLSSVIKSATTRQQFSFTSPVWGFGEFIRDEGQNLMQHVAEDGSITFKLDADIFLGPENVCSEVGRKRDLYQTIAGRAMCNNKPRLTIKFGKGRTFEADPFVMRARSGYFRAMSLHEKEESTTDEPEGLYTSAMARGPVSVTSEAPLMLQVSQGMYQMSDEWQEHVVECFLHDLHLGINPLLERGASAVYGADILQDLRHQLLRLCVKMEFTAGVEYTSKSLIESFFNRKNAETTFIVATSLGLDSLAEDARSVYKGRQFTTRHTDVVLHSIPKKLGISNDILGVGKLKKKREF